MKQLLLLYSVCLLTVLNSFGQTNQKKEIAFNFDYSLDTDTTTGICSLNMRMYETNFEYPKAALLNNIQGRVLVSFNLSEQCTITDIKIVKGLGYGLDKIALDIVALLGKDIKEKHTNCCRLNGIIVPLRFQIVADK